MEGLADDSSGFHVQSGEQSVLPLAARNALDVCGGSLDQVGAFVPDASKGVVAAFPDGPHHDTRRLARALYVEG